MAQGVETLRKALLEADRTKLEQVAAKDISYGHSDGRVETKEQFIHGVMTRKQTVKSLAFPELKIAVVGNAGIARHIYLSDSELEGKATTDGNARAIFRSKAKEIFGNRAKDAGTVPSHEIDELMLIASWFRTHPDEMKRTEAPERLEQIA